MKDVKRELNRIADQLKAAAENGETANVNVAGRRNIHIARNIGGEGGQHSASSSQTTRIVQRDGETLVDETTETRDTSA